MKQPRMLSNEEWDVVGEACGFIHKTYEEYREWKQKRVKWEKGNLVWGVGSEKVFPLANIDDRLFDAVRHKIQPPTGKQLDDYQNDPVELCEAARKAKGDEYFTEKGLGWLKGLGKLDVEPVKAGDIMVYQCNEHGDTTIVGKIMLKEFNPEANSSFIILADGSERFAIMKRLSHASPAQVDEFYTMKIDGEVIRFYRYLGDIWNVNENGNRWILADKGLTAQLALSFINQHYKHLVLPVDDVEEMVVPVGTNLEDDKK